MNKTYLYNNLIAGFAAVTLFTGVAVLESKPVYADCEDNYGGGETCIYNKRFEIDKKVRVKDEDESWKDKVTDVSKDDTVEFRIKIKNLSDKDITMNFNDMKMKDSLPDELDRVGGDGLTEYWDDFEPGETKTFYIRAKVDSDEYKDKNFEKCVVNKAEVKWKDKFEGADTATVCYGNSKPKELPKTGASAFPGVAGAGMLLAGFVFKKKTYLLK